VAADNGHLFVKFIEPGDFHRADIARRLHNQATSLSLLRARPGIIDARPLFTRDPRELLRRHEALWRAGILDLPDLTTWFRLLADTPERAVVLSKELDATGQFETILQPKDTGRPGEWPQRLPGVLHDMRSSVRVGLNRIGRRLNQLGTRTSSTKDLSRAQRYLLSAPWGIGAVDVPGWPAISAQAARRVAVVDDWWEETHEDLAGVQVVAQTGVSAEKDPHGTKVVGILLAQSNGIGMVGIAPGAALVFSYPYTCKTGEGKLYSIADAIERSLEHLSFGDVLLIERQVGGVMVEAERDCLDAIRHAVAQGILVIEPAGNAGQDLASVLPANHPDSGAIVVGAGQEGSPQRRVTRSRFVNSNYGACVRLQAFGYDVATLTDPSAYVGDGTPGFAETSAASAIVAGAALLASSLAKLLDPDGHGLSPSALRDIMVSTGSPQAPPDLQRPVGPQPNVPAILRAIRGSLRQQHNIAVPHHSPAPQARTLNVEDRYLLSLVASGLPDDAIANLLSLLAPVLPGGSTGPSGEQLARRRAALLAGLGVTELGVRGALQAAAIGEQLGLL
jgi:hypothetical protein